MNLLKSEEVHAAFKLREPILSIQPIIRDRIWCITTATQKYSLKCVTHTTDVISLEQVQRGNQIAKAFLSQGIPAVAPISIDENNFIIEIQGQHYLLFPWQKGNSCADETISTAHAFNVGKALGQLHNTHLNLDNIKESPWQVFSKPDWYWLQKQGEENNCPWSKTFNSSLITELNVWTENYFNAKAALPNKQVISHGDFIPQNIIWDHNLDMKIIDWDSAGWIHPEIELFGVAMNWAGIVAGKINQNLFESIYSGYQTIIPMKLVLKPEVIWASLGSWLKWLVINIQRSLVRNDEQTNQEIITTIEVIRKICRVYA